MELRAWGCPQRLALQQKAGCLAVLSRCAALGPTCCLLFQSPTDLTQTPLLLTAQLYPMSPHIPTYGAKCCPWLPGEGFWPWGAL